MLFFEFFFSNQRIALIGTAFGIALIVFVFVPQTATVFLWGEVVVFGIMLVVAGSESWLLGVMCLIAIVQVVLQLQARMRRSKKESGGSLPPVLSLGSFVKLLVFFLQTNLSVNERFWDAFSFVAQSLSFVNLDLSGAQCDARLAGLYGEEWSKLLVKMFFPVGLFAAIAVCLALRFAVQAMIRVCREKCKKKKRRPVEEEEIVAPLVREEDDHHHQHKESLGRSIANVGLFLAFVSYFELAEAIFAGEEGKEGKKLLKCRAVFRHAESRSGQVYLEEFPWIVVGTSSEEYWRLLIASACFLVVYVVGIPVLFAGLIFRNRGEGHVGEFLWENYKPKYFYFELVWLMR